MVMKFKIRYHKKVVHEDIKKLSKVTRRQIKSRIEDRLTSSPHIYSKSLRGSLKGNRSLRVGQYRVIFQIKNREIRTFAIMHRSIVYDRVIKRAD